MAAGFSFAATGCSDATPQPAQQSNERTGEGSLKLQLAPGATLTSASYTITGPSAYSKAGTIDVNNSSKRLVTQAFSASTAYDDIDLTIDPVTKDVVSKSAKIRERRAKALDDFIARLRAETPVEVP